MYVHSGLVVRVFRFDFEAREGRGISMPEINSGAKSGQLATSPGASSRTRLRAVSERRASRTVRYKKASPSTISLALYSAFTGSVVNLALPAALVWANPQGAQVVQGQATLQTQGNKLTVTNSAGAAINWQSFSIKANEQTHFQQPNSASSVLNRVVTNNPSEILGNLSSNGKVVVVNPFGITVGRGAAVDTAGFTASTLNISDADWAAGKLRFQGNALSGGVQVDGVIRSANGDIMLFAPNVSVGKDALVRADNGNVIVGAGQKVEVTGRGLEGVSFTIQSTNDKAINLGTLQGNAVGVFAGTLKHSGLIQAQTATQDGGRIVLRAVGNVELSPASKLIADGALLTPATGQNSSQNLLNARSGGQISVSSAQGDVSVGQGALVSAQGAGGGAGGQILVQAEQGSVQVQQLARIVVDGSPAGAIRVQAAQRAQVAGQLSAQSPVGAGGVAAATSGSGTSVEPIAINAHAKGGQIDVLGSSVALESGASLDASGDAGGGQIRVGGDYQGKNADVPNARTTDVAPGVTLVADGRAVGDGGKVIVWADEDTHFSGTLQARGGEQGGNGGFGETSGKKHLYFRGAADLGARRGRVGTLLLDPESIEIGALAAADNGQLAAGTPSGRPEGEIQYGDGTTNTAYTISITGIEAASVNADIVLEASRRIFVGAGVDDGTINLANNRSITLRTRNATGDPSGTQGIDLTTRSTLLTGGGSTFAIVASGTGGVTLQTGLGTSPLSANITTGLIMAGSGGVAIYATGDVSINNTMTTANGNVVITGNTVTTISGSNNGHIVTNGGSIQIYGTAAGSYASPGIAINSTLNTYNGTFYAPIDLQADRLSLTGSASLLANRLSITPRTASRQIVLGGDDSSNSANFLGITTAELNQVAVANIIQIGDGSSGTGGISLSSAGLSWTPSTLSLQTVGAITQAGGGNLSVGSLYLKGSAVTLDSTSHTITGALAGATTSGDFRVKTSGNYTLGSADGTKGIASASGITLTGGGSDTLTIGSTSAVTLTAQGTIQAAGFTAIKVDNADTRIDSNTSNTLTSGKIDLGFATLSATGASKGLTLDSSSGGAGGIGGEIRFGSVAGPTNLQNFSVVSSGSLAANSGEIILQGNSLGVAGGLASLTGKVRLGTDVTATGALTIGGYDLQNFSGNRFLQATAASTEAINISVPVGTGTALSYLSLTAGEIGLASATTQAAIILSTSGATNRVNLNAATLSPGAASSITISSGSVRLFGDNTFSGSVAAGSTVLALQANNTTQTFSSNASFGGAFLLTNSGSTIAVVSGKTVNLGAGSLDTGSGLSLTGTGGVQFTTLSDNKGTLSLGAGTFTSASGNLSNSGIVDFGTAGLLVVNGNIVNTGLLRGSGGALLDMGVSKGTLVNAAGGTIAPGGVGTVGTLTVSQGHVTLASGSTLATDVNGLTSGDRLSVALSFTGNAGATISVAEIGSSVRTGSQYDLILFTGTGTGLPSVVSAVSGVSGFASSLTAASNGALRLTPTGVTTAWNTDASGLWTADASWTRGTPTATSFATIARAASTNVSSTSGSASASTLTLGNGTNANTLNLTGGTLSVGTLTALAASSVLVPSAILNLTGNSTVAGTLSVGSTGTIAGAGNLDVSGLLSFDRATFGTVGGPNGTLGTSGATIVATLASSFGTLYRNWNNTGTINWLGGEELRLAASTVTMTNAVGGVINVLGDGALIGSSGRFVNSGTLARSSGTGTATIDTAAGFDNLGTVSVATGTLRLARGNFTAVSDTGSYTIGSGATLASDVGARTLSSGAGISGAGRLALLGGTLTTAASQSISTLDISGGSLVAGGSGVSVTSSLSWSGGSISGSGGFTLGSLASGSLSNSLTLDAIWTNSGAVTYGGTGPATWTLSAAALLSNYGGFTLAPTTGSITVGGAFGGISNQSGASFVNANGSNFITLGSTVGLRIYAGSTVAVTGGSLAVSTIFGGTNSGTLLTSVGTTFSTASANLINAGLLAGSGTVNVGSGTLTNASGGTIAPGGVGSVGTLAVTGNVSLSSGSTLGVDVSSATVADRLVVNGSFISALGATISVAETAGAVRTSSLYDVISYTGTGTGTAPTVAESIVDVAGFTSTLTAASNGFVRIQPTGVATTWNTDSDGLWSTDASWTRGTPNATSSAFIARALTNPIVTVDGSAAVGTLAVSTGDSLAVQGLTASLNIGSGGASFNSGTLSISTGAVAGGGAININAGSLVLANATLAGTGTLGTASGVTTSVGAGNSVLQRDWVNNGTINFGTSAALNVGTAPSTPNTLTNASGGVVNMLSSSQVVAVNSVGSASAFVNAGTVNANASTGAIDLGGPLGAFNNSGTVNVTAGSAYVPQGTDIASARYNVSSGATMDMSGPGTHSFASGSQINGSGTFQSTNVSAVSNVNGGFALATGGTVSVTGGELHITNGSPLTFNNAITVSGTGSTLDTGASNITLASGGALSNSGLLMGSGTVNLTGGTFTLSSGIIGGGGSLAVASGGTVFITGGQSLLQRNATNFGTVNWDTFGRLIMSASSTTLTNASGGIMNVNYALGSPALSLDASNNAFNNAGTLNWNATNNGIYSTYGSATFSNSGTVSIASGQTMTLALPGTVSQTGTVNLLGGAAKLQRVNADISNAGLISGTGTIDVGSGTLINASGGILAPGGVGNVGTLYVAGNATLASGSTLAIDVGTATTGDKLAITGNYQASTGATISVAEASTVVLANSQYDVISFTGTGSGLPAFTSALTDVTGFSGAQIGNVLRISPTGVTTRWNTSSNGFWDADANWTRGTPGATTSAVIAYVGFNPTVTVTTASAAGTLSVSTGDTLVVQSGSLSVGAGGTSISGATLNLAGGTLGGAGEINVSGSGVLGFGNSTLNGTGTLGIASTANLNITGDAHLLRNATNAGTINWSGTGRLYVDGANTTLTNAVGGIANAGGTATYAPVILNATGAVFNNAGTLNWNETNSLLGVDSTNTFNNSGSLNIAPGKTMTLAQPFVSSGLLSVGSGAVLRINSGGSITGNLAGAAGAIELVSGQLQLSGNTGTNIEDAFGTIAQGTNTTLLVSGGAHYVSAIGTLGAATNYSVAMTAGTLNVGSAFDTDTLSFSGANTTLTTATANLNADVVSQTGGTIAFGGSTTVRSSFMQSGGSFGATGPINFDLGSSGTAISIGGSLSSGSTVFMRAAGVSIGSGGSIVGNSSGTGIEIASGTTGFTNSAGTGALSVTGGGSWLVWAQNPVTLDSPGGLAPAFKQYDAVYNSTAVAGSGNGLLYTVAPTATPTLVGGTTRSYLGLGNTTATLSAGAVTGAGIDGDSVTLAAGSATYDSGNAGARSVTANGISVVGASNGGAIVYGYQLASTSANSTGTIAKANATVMANSNSLEYDGTTLSVGGFSASGLVGGETSIVLTGVTTSGGSGRNAGSYGLIASGMDSNYNLSFIPGGLTITPKAVTLTAASVSKTYDGGLTYVTQGADLSTLSGQLVGGDTVSSATLSYANKNAGAGNKAITLDAVLINDTNSGNNYSLTLVGNNLSTITQAGLTLAASSDSRVYNAGTLSGGTVSATGFVAGDSLSTAASQSFASKNVLGTNNSTLNVNAGYVIADGNSGGNYAVTLQGASGSITAASLTVAATGVNRTYNGNAAASVTLSDNRIGGDALTDGYSSASFVNKNAGTGKTVTVSGISIGGTDAGNYTLASTSAATTANIAQAGLTLAASSDSRVYNAGTLSGGTVSATGFVAGDSLSTAASQSFASKNVLGTNNSTLNVNAGYVIADGNSGGNYAVTLQGASGSITAASLTVAAVTDNRGYNGTSVSAGSVSKVGLQGADTVTSLSQAFDSKNAGVRTLSVASGYSVNDGNSGNNYLLTVNTASGNISQATLTVGATGISRSYDGGTLASVNYSDNRLGTDALTVSGSANFTDKNWGNAKPITVTGISLSGADAGNYMLQSPTVTTSANVSQRALSIWTGSATGGVWSSASNWDALPDGTNVLAVSIGSGTGAVTYDLASLTSLQSLTGGRILGQSNGVLAVSGAVSVGGLSQSGGTLSVGGAFSANGSTITQSGGVFTVSGLASLTATGGSVSLASTANSFGGGVLINAAGGTLGSSSALTIGGTIANGGALSLNAPSIALGGGSFGTLSVGGPLFITTTGSLTQGAAINVGGASSLNAADINLSRVNSFGGPVSFSAGSGAVTLGSAGAINLGNASAGRLVLTANGALTRTAGGTFAVPTVDIVATSIGSAATPFDLGNTSKANLVATAGDVNVIDSGDLSLGTVAASGSAAVSTTGRLQATGARLAAGTSLALKAGGNIDLTAVSARANSVSLIGNNISILGGSADNLASDVYGTSLVSVDAKGNFVISGGLGTDSHAALLSDGSANIQYGGTMSLAGGAGLRSYAKVDATKGVTAATVATNLTGKITLTGGGNTSAYAAIVSERDVVLDAPSLALNKGTGVDADAVVMSFLGTVKFPSANCTGCDLLTVLPLSNGTTESGIIGGVTFLSLIVQGTQSASQTAAFTTAFAELTGKDKKKDPTDVAKPAAEAAVCTP